MSTDEKPTSLVVPEANPEVATKKPAKAAKPKAAASKPVGGTKTKRAAAQPAAQPVEEIAVPTVTETAPQSVESEPVETDGESRTKKEKKKGKKKHKKSKEAVIIRFDDTQLPQIDAQAEALGLSRAAWVRMVVAKALS